MRKVAAFVLVFGAAVLTSGVALAGADCTASHTTQASVDKADPAKIEATLPVADKTDASQVQTAQAEKPAKLAAETKK